MNMEITKSKNNNSANNLIKRLARLEMILARLQEESAGVARNARDIEQGGEFTALTSFSAKSMRISKANQSVIKAIGATTIPRNNRKNLLLSQGQIIAELALLMARANQRNS